MGYSHSGHKVRVRSQTVIRMAMVLTAMEENGALQGKVAGTQLKVMVLLSVCSCVKMSLSRSSNSNSSWMLPTLPTEESLGILD